MKYIKQLETSFTAHGHWLTQHEVIIKLNDALILAELIKKAYPDAVTQTDQWVCGKINADKLPDKDNFQQLADVLNKILSANP